MSQPNCVLSTPHLAEWCPSNFITYPGNLARGTKRHATKYFTLLHAVFVTLYSSVLGTRDDGTKRAAE